MKKLLAVLSVAALLPVAAFAAVKTYQVTGPVLEIRDDAIVVQKGKDKWEIAKDASAKVTGDLKVGANVTIEYTMSVKTVTVKADKPAKGAKAAKSAAAPAAAPASK
jgi:opacity protein-like surface antigen